MNKLTQLTYGILSLVLLTVIAFPKVESRLGGGAFFINVSRSATATTTAQMLNSTGIGFTKVNHAGVATTRSGQIGSTTAIYKIDQSVAYDLNLMMVASNTDSQLVWSYAFSNNYNEATGDGDWFFEDGSSVDSVTQKTHGNRLQHLWTPGTSSSSETCGTLCFTKGVDVDELRARHVKIYFGSRVASSSLWHELARELPNSR